MSHATSSLVVDVHVEHIVTSKHTVGGLRLPYCDKASNVIDNPDDKMKVKAGLLSKTKASKKKVSEDRPLRAVGKVVFEFGTSVETGNDVLDGVRDFPAQDISSLRAWGLGPWQICGDVPAVCTFVD